MSFCHLHTHSHYSLLNAIPKIKELVHAAKEDAQSALALTDDGNLYGTIEFVHACEKEGIKPIIGVDFYLAPRTRHDKEHRIDNHTSRLVLLAKNETGYKNLIALVTESFLDGFYYKPRIDTELIEKYKDGLLAILPSFAAPTSKALKDGDEKKAGEILEWYKERFGEDLYLELTMHDELIGHRELMEKVAALGAAHSVPLVAAHDVYYLHKEDNVARELVNRIKTGTTLTEDAPERPDDFSFISQETAQEYFADYPEALANVQKVVEKCELKLDLGNWTFPDFPKDAGKSYDAMLREATYAGLKKRDLELTDEIEKRIEYELGVIADKGYSPYFLVVSDLMRHAKEVGIYTNTRGSAAGSLVSYLTEILHINPLDYNLPFERFLNPERPSPPDIDMDLADNRRDDLIDYAREKYGTEAVAQIGTFGTMAARAAVRDVARALGHSYGVGDRIAKLIPFGAQGFPMTIHRALELEPELKEAYDTDSETHEIIDLARKIEGNARHMGVHAAGVVIAPTKLIDFVPVQHDPKGGKLVTQYDMHAVEDAGLLKYDFLGLKNLAVLADSVKRVEKIHGTVLDPDNFPLDDAKTFAMLSEGRTMGVFQLASSGMTKWLVELEPSTVHDLNAMVALYRPGPMEFIPHYVNRKHGKEPITYLHPDMKDILENSYGVLTYQDDVLMIAIKFAGYSWLEADKFRKAIGKKIPEEMAEQKDKFCEGCIAYGMNEKTVSELWNQIETFAAYGFNKSHAASYGNLAYRTAYMKANYPLEFMSALLTADSGDTEKIAEIIDECVKMEIEILPPDVNESYEGFLVVQGKRQIRFGLTTIKNFGENIAHAIVEERKARGAYASVADFLTRVESSNLNRRSLEALIKAGAFDSLSERGTLIANLDVLLQFHKEVHGAPQGQDSLFGGADAVRELSLAQAEAIPLSQILAWEKELLGLYISGHPLEEYKERLSGKPTITETKQKAREGVTVVLAGIVAENKTIITKKGEKMAFVRLADMNDAIEVVVFPKTFTEHADLLTPDACVLAKGRISKRNGEMSFVAEAFKAL